MAARAVVTMAMHGGRESGRRRRGVQTHKNVQHTHV